MLRRSVSTLAFSMAMALAAFGATSASSAGAEYSQAPLPSTACRSGITAHLFTFAQARRCAPEATVITTGQVVSKAGRYLLQQPAVTPWSASATGF